MPVNRDRAPRVGADLRVRDIAVLHPAGALRRQRNHALLQAQQQGSGQWRTDVAFRENGLDAADGDVAGAQQPSLGRDQSRALRPSRAVTARAAPERNQGHHPGEREGTERRNPHSAE